MRRRDQLSALCWVLFSGLIIWQAGSLPIGTLRSPRPGFLPLILGILLAVLSLLLLILSLLKERKNKKDMEKLPERFFSSPHGWKRVALTIAALLIYNLFFETMGFLICTFLFLIILFKIVELQRWTFSVITSAVVSICAYILFEVILKSNLPRGILEGLRF